MKKTILDFLAFCFYYLINAILITIFGIILIDIIVLCGMFIYHLFMKSEILKTLAMLIFIGVAIFVIDSIYFWAEKRVKKLK